MSSYIKSPPLLNQLLNILDPPQYKFTSEEEFRHELTIEN